MRQIKKYIFAAFVGVMLAACSTPKSEPTGQALLSAEQSAIQQNGVNPDAVYDAVDGATIAIVAANDKTKPLQL